MNADRVTRRDTGLWSHGPAWSHPVLAAAPWLTFLFSLVVMAFADRRFAVAPGIEFELPEMAETDRVSVPDLTAVAQPSSDGKDVLVFFDDVRYSLSEPDSLFRLADGVRERTAKREDAELLLFADRRVAAGDLMKVVEVLRLSGVSRVLVAERNR